MSDYEINNQNNKTDDRADNALEEIRVLEVSAEQGDARSQVLLGLRHEFGLDVSADHEKSFYWYMKAAEQGYVRGQFYLGHCYEDGIGVKQEHEKAVYWYEKAAEQGDFNAQNKLGWHENYQRCTKRVDVKAFKWQGKVAEQGDTEAQHSLGHFYDGVKRNYGKAEEPLYSGQSFWDNLEDGSQLIAREELKLEKEVWDGFAVHTYEKKLVPAGSKITFRGYKNGPGLDPYPIPIFEYEGFKGYLEIGSEYDIKDYVLHRTH